MVYDGYQWSTGTVKMLPARATRMWKAPRDEDGNLLEPDALLAKVQEPVMKHTCLLCKQPCDEQHTAFGRAVWAHSNCINTGLQALNKPNRTNKPVRKAYVPPVARTNTGSVNRTAYTEQDKQEARYLVHALAQVLRGE